KLRNTLDSNRSAERRSSGSMLPEVPHVLVVDQIGLTFGPRSSHGDVGLCPVKSALASEACRGVVRHNLDARRQLGQLRIISAIQRQVRNLFRPDQGGNGRVRGLDLRNLALHANGLRHVSNWQSK